MSMEALFCFGETYLSSVVQYADDLDNAPDRHNLFGWEIVNRSSWTTNLSALAGRVIPADFPTTGPTCASGW